MVLRDVANSLSIALYRRRRSGDLRRSRDRLRLSLLLRPRRRSRSLSRSRSLLRLRRRRSSSRSRSPRRLSRLSSLLDSCAPQRTPHGRKFGQPGETRAGGVGAGRRRAWKVRAGGGGLLGVASVAAAHGSLALAALSFLLLSPLALLELAAAARTARGASLFVVKCGTEAQPARRRGGARGVCGVVGRRGTSASLALLSPFSPFFDGAAAAAAAAEARASRAAASSDRRCSESWAATHSRGLPVASSWSRSWSS